MLNNSFLKKLISKKNSVIYITLLFVFSSVQSHASLEDPTLGDLFDLLVRVFNIAMLCVGGVLVLMIAYGAFKASMSLGDPKGLEAAKATWVNALIGAFIVLGVFVIFNIVLGFFGISDTFKSGIGIFDQFTSAFKPLLDILQIH